jgi:hypothetical protein
MASSNAKHSEARPASKKATVPSAAKNTTSTTAVRSAVPGMSRVEKRAFEIYLKRISSGIPGDEMADWLQAESELRSQAE